MHTIKHNNLHKLKYIVLNFSKFKHLRLHLCKRNILCINRGDNMGKIITLGLQKGGVSKTTTTGILAHLLAEDKSKVLVVDMDSQANLTELLTEEPANNFIDKSIFEAIVYKNPQKYIYEVNRYIDIIPSNNFLASFARWIYTKRIPGVDQSIVYDGKPYEQLNLTLKIIKDNYDYILIDTPPSLSEQTT